MSIDLNRDHKQEIRDREVMECDWVWEIYRQTDEEDARESDDD